MKALIKWNFYLLSGMVLLLSGCATGKTVVNGKKASPDDKVYEIESPLSLSDFLRRVPGVYFEWDTGVPTIRGGYPLYVIDGMRMGHDYYEVARMVNVHDIASVEVIRSATEGLIYGRDVAHGVVVIRTKTGQ
jgi:hypothetical protein